MSTQKPEKKDDVKITENQTENENAVSTPDLDAFMKELEAKNAEILNAKLAELEAAKQEYAEKAASMSVEKTTASPVESSTTSPRIDNQKLVSEAKKVGEKLSKQKKIAIMIPKDLRNPKETHVPVTISGYTYQIARGESVEVPVEVYNILKEAKYI